MNARLLYLCLFGIAAVSAFAKTLAYAGLLPAAEFGTVMLALLVSTLGSYPASLGILDGLSREVPIRRGAGENVRRLRSDGVVGVAVLAAATAALATVACAFAARGDAQLDGLPLAGAVLFCTVLLNALLGDLQTRELSNQYAGILAAKSLLALACAPLFAHWGAAGILGAEVVALGVCIVACLCAWSRDLLWRRPQPGTLRALIRVGLPFTLSNLLSNLAMSLDRWAVQLSLGIAALGSYAFAMHFSSVGLVLLNMLHLYAAPRMLRAFGASGDPQALLRTGARLALVTIVAFSLLAAPVLFAFPLLVERWYPEYRAAGDLAVWVYAGTAAITIGFYDILFKAAADGRQLVWINLAAAALVAVACAAIAVLDAPLWAYACVFCATRIGTAAAGWLLGAQRVRMHAAPVGA